MIIKQKEFTIKGLACTIRSAQPDDAAYLSKIRVQIDGETENMDREAGEAFITPSEFEQLIKHDSADPKNLFLVALVDHKIAGFSRCEGNHLKRLAHKAEFGVCVLKKYWGLHLGPHLLQESIAWAETIHLKKITLNVLETNEKAINVYKRFGFEVEGILRNDNYLSDGCYYSTLVMGRLNV
ncbi:GNAT family N-acetyltransferase [Sporolactobacillus terrae]|uniref:GNAT family N-acetyltransferase n=1 Tax=Sporolactobacillus terrae TaxID=269673 RepID=UPI00048AC851|nr:GNAT family N-acetyltransferase [Sporolactobacillus terrae]